jgi:hypothetical protein
MPSAMVFHDVPVGIVARVIGARLGRNIEIETGDARLVSGDFGHGSLIQALSDAAGKAGLVVVDEGAEGLHLVSRNRFSVAGHAVPAVDSVVGTPMGLSAADLAEKKQREEILKAAEAKRSKLLRLRAKLLLEEPEP